MCLALAQDLKQSSKSKIIISVNYTYYLVLQIQLGFRWALFHLKVTLLLIVKVFY